MLFNLLHKKEVKKEDKKELISFAKKQFSELARKQLAIPVKLYQL